MHRRCASGIGVAGAVVAMMAALGVTKAAADSVPRHLVKLSVDLLRGTADARRAEQPDAAHAAVAGAAERQIKDAGMLRWSGSAVERPGALAAMAQAVGVSEPTPEDAQRIAALFDVDVTAGPSLRSAVRGFLFARGETDPSDDRVNKLAEQVVKVHKETLAELDTRQRLDLGDGRQVELHHAAALGKMYIRLFDPGQDGGEPSFSVIEGAVRKQAAADGSGIELTAEPVADPIRLMTAADLDAQLVGLYGDWLDGEGKPWIIAAAGGGNADGAGADDGDGAANAQALAAKRKELAAAKADEVFLWRDPTTGETIEQKKFKRLAEPYEYVGERSGAADEVARLTAEIADLERLVGAAEQRHSEITPPPFQNDELPRPIVLYRVNSDGYKSAYVGQYSTGRIEARNRINDVRDIGEGLPEPVNRQIANQWRPEQWLDLDLVNGPDGLRLIGLHWSWLVTYDGMSLEVSRIHTPYSAPLVLERSRALVAQGGRYPEEGP